MSVSSIINAFGIEQMPKRALWLFANGIADLGLSPDCAAVVVSIESAFNPKALNKYSGASGLLQVMPGLTKNYGFSSAAAVRSASSEEQVKRIVIPHFKSFTGALKSIGDDCGAYYMAVFLPKFISSPDDVVLGEKDSSEIVYGKTTRGAVYAQNFGFDTDHDGVFTVGDVKNFARGYAKKDAQRPRVTVPASLPRAQGDSGVKLGLAVAAGAVIYALTRRRP